MPARSRAEMAASTTLAGAFGTREYAALARSILDVLPVDAPHGFAVRVLADAIGLPIKTTPQARLQRVTKVLGVMERHGWVARLVNGKRTFMIEHGPVTPDDWSPSPNGHGPVLDVGDYAVVDAAVDAVAPYLADEDADARTDVGGRPGRFVARLQRELPALVADAVTAALDEDRRRVFVALGYAPPDTGTDPDALEQANDALAALTGRVAELEHALRDERADAHAAREELNRVIGSNERVTTSPLKARDVYPDLRPLAEHALAHGWTIRRTNGGHLAFRSPAGSQQFHSATPSDWRAIKNFRAQLEAVGLPRQGK